MYVSLKTKISFIKKPPFKFKGGFLLEFVLCFFYRLSSAYHSAKDVGVSSSFILFKEI